jgi:hypothetical protein
MDAPAQTTSPLDARRQMAAEAQSIVTAARERGVILRLLGGLAVRRYCRGLAFCDRDHSDLDMVGLSRQIVGVSDVMGSFGYREDPHVRIATQSRQAQFSRPCVHAAAGGELHDDDHVDLFLDKFRMDHDIDLRRRLALDDVTLPASDVLLTKLQVARPDSRDVGDIVTMLNDVALGGADRPGMVNVTYISALCAGDWGLFYDVTRTLQRCGEALDGLGLDAPAEERVRGALTALVGALDAAPKTRRWRLRARIGTRRPWHHLVEEQERAGG